MPQAAEIGTSLGMDWEPQCCEQLRDPGRCHHTCPRPVGADAPSGTRQAVTSVWIVKRGNDAATGPNCRFDLIKWKPPCAIILNMFCSLPSLCLFNLCSDRLSQLSKQRHCLAMDTSFSTTLRWNKHLHTVHETIRNRIRKKKKKNNFFFPSLADQMMYKW